MIIRCPYCATRYRLGPQALGPAGLARFAAPAIPSLAAQPLVPTAMLFTVGIMFGLTFSLNRIAATDGIPFILNIFCQSVGAGLLLLAFAFIFRVPPGFSK